MSTSTYPKRVVFLSVVAVVAIRAKPPCSFILAAISCAIIPEVGDTSTCSRSSLGCKGCYHSNISTTAFSESYWIKYHYKSDHCIKDGVVFSPIGIISIYHVESLTDIFLTIQRNLWSLESATLTLTKAWQLALGVGDKTCLRWWGSSADAMSTSTSRNLPSGAFCKI